MSQYIKQILAVLIGLGLIIFIIVLIVRGFQSGSRQEQVQETALITYAATDTVASFTVDGPIVADRDHHSTKITVSRTDVSIDVVQGYEGSVILHDSFANNQPAYASFLSGLQQLGFTQGNKNPDFADERGACPAGSRFIYSLNKTGDDIFRFWSTTCGNTSGTFRGQASAVRNLFEAQIPKEAPSKLLSYN